MRLVLVVKDVLFVEVLLDAGVVLVVEVVLVWKFC